MSAPAALGDQRLLLAYALFGGPLWWMVHLVGASVLVPVACEYGVERLIDVLTAVTAAGAAMAMAAGVGMHRRVGATDAGAATGRRRLLAFVAVASSGISVLLILLEGAPTLVLGPCR